MMDHIMDHDLLSIQEARILAENAAAAQKQIETLSQGFLDKVVEHVAGEIGNHVKELAIQSEEETDCGRWEDKLLKNRFACETVAGALRGMRCVGIIRRDEQARTMDIGVPRGTIAAFCPATSPVSTAIYNILIAIKSGNSIVFSPHPKAKNVMARALDIMIRAAEESGFPKGAISYLHTVSVSGSQELIQHKSTALLLATGVPSLLPLLTKSGKPVIYGGAGNGPAFIERTADLEKAVRDIVRSKLFDYGAVTTAEQSVVVDAPVAEKVKREFQKLGAYFLSQTEAQRLGNILFCDSGGFNEALAGKPAGYLAQFAGFTVPAGTTLLISEQKYVSEKNPYIKETLCPVLTYYVEDDWRHACEKCIELLLGEKQGHTLVIHSRDEAVIEQFALKKPVARVLVNTPASLGGMGVTTNLFPAMTLGSGTAGLGMTTENVSPMNLIYVRKVGYGVREPEERFGVKTERNYGLAELENFRDLLKEFVMSKYHHDCSAKE